MNSILIPASFLAVAMPAAHSILVTDSGIRSWKQDQQAAVYSTAELTVFAEPSASDDPAWYNNYE